MIKLHMLAASARPIADVLIDSLRANGRFSRLRATLSDDEERDHEQHQFSLELEDESNEKGVRSAPQILHPDEAAAAVLLGKAFERSLVLKAERAVVRFISYNPPVRSDWIAPVPASPE